MTNVAPKKSTNPPDLGVEVSEEISTDESLAKWKPWFNGAKFFHTIKVLPKSNK